MTQEDTRVYLDYTIDCQGGRHLPLQVTRSLIAGGPLYCR